MKQSTDSNATTTSSIDTTGASLLVLAISYVQPVGPGTISDSKTNTWVQAGTKTSAGGVSTAIFYVKNPTSVGTGHTFTGGTAADFPTLFVAAFSGTDISQNRDQENTGSATPVNTVQPGSVTPTVNNELLVTSIGGAIGGAVYSIDTGFTVTDTVSVSPGLAYGGALAYLVQGTAAATNPTWTATGAVDTLVSAIDTFFPAAGGAPSWLLMGIGR